MKKIQLPDLAFGSHKAHTDTSEYSMQERLKLLQIALYSYVSTAESGAFINQSFFTSINGLTIGSTASTPIQVELKQVNTPMLVIPLAGSGGYHMGGENIMWRAADRAALLPAEGFTGESTLRSSLAILIDPDRLNKTVHSMLGVEGARSNLIELDRPQEIALQYGNVSFDRVFRKLTEAIDLLSSEPDLLSLSGLDEAVYRAMATMLRPDLFKIKANKETCHPHGRALLDNVCQYIQDNLHESITLTDLERVSCMSQRNLHYAFQNYLQHTPMQWVRVRRLEAARSMLVKEGSLLSIGALALLCGFSNSSTFSNYYKLRFGELPSATIANCR